MQAEFKKVVSLLTSNHIAVLADLHWTAPGTNLATGQQELPDKDHGQCCQLALPPRPGVWIAMPLHHSCAGIAAVHAHKYSMLPLRFESSSSRVRSSE